jgi:ATP-dependent DNA helicase RecQ
LANVDFFNRLLPLIRRSVGLFIVDEAHCISDWGHDFRPDYRRIIRILRLLPTGVPIICTTATANNRVVKDIGSQIEDLHIRRGPLVRSSLRLFNIKLDDQSDRLAWLVHFLPQLLGAGIIYTLTVQDSRRVAAFLQSRSIVARAYNADLEAAERIQAERQLLNNEVKALVATVALGMGFDKPDLGFVIHFQRPGSVVAYYQQVGRAGRAVDSAYGILLNGREDDEIQDYFINSAFPPLEVMEGVLRVLKKSSSLTLSQIGAELNYSRGALDKALRLLEVDGAVQREKIGFSRTVNPWKSDAARFTQVTEHRRAELAEMKRYVEHTGCLMEFLSSALDDPAAAPCGKCMNCAQRTQRRLAPVELKTAASQFLRSDALVLEPRTSWPQPVLDELLSVLPEAVDRHDNGRPKTTLPARLQAQPGRALSIYGDSGWGQEVARGKYHAARFSDSLVTAAAELIKHKWRPDPWPEWVTAVPSQGHSELVRDFAQRLAAALELPFVPALLKSGGKRPQKEMQNSPKQLRNVLKAFQIVDAPNLDFTGDDQTRSALGRIYQRFAQAVNSSLGNRPTLPPVPVLLVDDIVDSGWTMTLAAALLRRHGSGPVYPFALAKASPRGG